jgi:hypothetical protein
VRFAFSIKKGLSTCVNSPGVYKAGFLRVHSFECRFCFHDQALTNAGWAWFPFSTGDNGLKQQVTDLNDFEVYGFCKKGRGKLSGPAQGYSFRQLAD